MTVRLGGSAGLCNGLSRMSGNHQVRFLGEDAAARPHPYPTKSPHFLFLLCFLSEVGSLTKTSRANENEQRKRGGEGRDRRAGAAQAAGVNSRAGANGRAEKMIRVL